MWFYHFITRIVNKVFIALLWSGIRITVYICSLKMTLQYTDMAYPIIETYAMFDHIQSVLYMFIHPLKKKAKLSLKFVLDWKFVEIFIRKTFLKKTIWRSWLERINLLCWPSIFHLHRVIFKLVIYSHWLQTCHSIKNVLFCFDLHFLK